MWAELVVEAGAVVFVVEESGEETTVPVGSRHVIVPHERHAVSPGPAARFHVQFWTDGHPAPGGDQSFPN